MVPQRRAVFLSLIAAAVATAAAAQGPPLTLPQPSQAAAVSQTVGLTEVTITYHRPRVGGREIWGKLVPFGEVWRAGANENTTIEYSSPVTVDGHPLAAGRYGFHAIPTAGEWTLIFSSVDTGWGSFGYQPGEDVLRFTVHPEPAPHVEALAYFFDDATDRQTTVSLRWEKLRVPFTVTVDTPEVVYQSLRRELRGAPQFFWQPWNQAAARLITDGVHLDVAAEWVDRSISIQRNFTNLRTRARLLAVRGDTAGAESLLAEALAMASEAEVNALGYERLAAGDVTGAIEAFRRNVEDHPESWNVHDSLAEGLAAAGDTAGAIAGYEKALAMAPAAQRERIESILNRLKGRSGSRRGETGRAQ